MHSFQVFNVFIIYVDFSVNWNIAKFFFSGLKSLTCKTKDTCKIHIDFICKIEKKNGLVLIKSEKKKKLFYFWIQFLFRYGHDRTKIPYQHREQICVQNLYKIRCMDWIKNQFDFGDCLWCSAALKIFVY